MSFGEASSGQNDKVSLYLICMSMLLSSFLWIIFRFCSLSVFFSFLISRSCFCKRVCSMNGRALPCFANPTSVTRFSAKKSPKCCENGPKGLNFIRSPNFGKLYRQFPKFGQNERHWRRPEAAQMVTNLSIWSHCSQYLVPLNGRKYFSVPDSELGTRNSELGVLSLCSKMQRRRSSSVFVVRHSDGAKIGFEWNRTGVVCHIIRNRRLQ